MATLTGSQTLTNKTLTTPVVSGNLTTDGLIDGRDVATDGTKLDTIESSATADQTDAEIKTAYENNSDTNAFTDAEKTKLSGIEASADVTDTTNVTAAGALMDSEVTNLAQVKAFDSSDYATAAQGTTADAALPRTGGAMTGAITTNSTFDGRDVATDGTKLDGIEASADVTDTANVTAAGALMDSELTAIASVKALDQGVATTDSPAFTNLTLNGTGSVKVPAGTTAQRDGSPAAGMFRYNSTLAQFEGYTDAWGSIGGGGGTNTFTTDSFTGNGSTTAYALSQTVSSEDNLLVFIEGVFQQQDAYSIATSGGTTTLTFSSAPANGNSILIYSVAAAVSGSNLNIDSMTGDGSDVTLTLTIAPVNENNTQVFIDGVYQNKSTYSISGTTLTFSTAPPNGSAVEVMTMTQTDINVPVDGTITSAKLSGDLTLPGDLSFADNNKAIFGAGSDLQIYHDGSNSIITDQGSGTLKIQGDSAVRLESTAGERYFVGTNNGAARLYHDDSEKLATTNTGIDVTGTAVTDGLTVDGFSQLNGNLSVASNLPRIILKENDTTDLNTAIRNNGGVFKIQTVNDAANSFTNRMDINHSSGNVILYGDVGIGTTSPTRALSVFGDTAGVISITSNSTDGISSLSFGDTADDNAGRVNYLNASDAMLFYTATAERMRIDSSGQIKPATGSNIGVLQNLHVSIGTSATLAIDMGDAVTSDKGAGLYMVSIVRTSGSYGRNFVGIFGVNSSSVVLYETLRINGITVTVSGTQILGTDNSSGTTYDVNAIPLVVDKDG